MLETIFPSPLISCFALFCNFTFAALVATLAAHGTKNEAVALNGFGLLTTIVSLSANNADITQSLGEAGVTAGENFGLVRLNNVSNKGFQWVMWNQIELLNYSFSACFLRSSRCVGCVWKFK